MLVFYKVHGSWNIIEGHRRMMTKEYKTSIEHHLRRILFMISDKGNKGEEGYQTI